jgi:hypothetical protein
MTSIYAGMYVLLGIAIVIAALAVSRGIDAEQTLRTLIGP